MGAVVPRALGDLAGSSVVGEVDMKCPKPVWPGVYRANIHLPLGVEAILLRLLTNWSVLLVHLLPHLLYVFDMNTEDQELGRLDASLFTSSSVS